MRIYGYDFAASGEVRFMPVTGVQFSEMNLDEYSAIPQGTSMSWDYSADEGVTWDAVVHDEEDRLPYVATRVLLRAKFTGSSGNDSPALNFGDVNLVGFLNSAEGTYISRANELTQGVESTKVYAEMSIPSGCLIIWFASNDGEETWEEMALDSTREVDQT